MQMSWKRWCSYLNALQLLPYSQIICNYLLDLALSLCFLWFGQCNSAFVLLYLMKDFQVSLSIQSTRAERTSVSCTPGYFYLKASICKGSAALGSREKCAHSVFYFWINVGLGGGKAGGGSGESLHKHTHAHSSQRSITQASVDIESPWIPLCDMFTYPLSRDQGKGLII